MSTFAYLLAALFFAGNSIGTSTRTVVHHEPYDPTVNIIKRATTLLREGEFDKAERIFRDVIAEIERDAVSSEAAYLQLQIARDACFAAWRKDPLATAGLRDFIMECDYYLGDKTGAEKRAAVFLEFDPKHSLANFFMGQLAFEKGDLKKAELYLRQSIETKPDSRACNCFGVVLQRTERHAESEQYSRQSIQLAKDAGLRDTHLAAIYDTLAVALARQGKFLEAREAMSETLFIMGEWAQFHPALMLTQLEIAVGLEEREEARGFRDKIAFQVAQLDDFERELFIRLSDKVAEFERP